MAVIAIAVVAVTVVLFWPITDLIAAHDVGRITGPIRAQRLQMARDAARGRLLQLGAGLFAAGALLYTARNFILSREGQVTDRYTKAVAQLGDEELDVRIGGIYALERIARDSTRDYPTVMEVLATFVREHSQEEWPPSGRAIHDPDADAVPRATRPDVQAAITVIGRRRSKGIPLPINLTGAKLVRVDLTLADLRRVNLSHADLYRASLVGSNLTDAILDQAALTRASLTDANLTSAKLFHADLYDADLSGADLTDADLNTADLSEARLPGAKLTRADLADVRFPSTGIIPEGWEIDPSSQRLKRVS
jgi:hypothetical protein